MGQPGQAGQLVYARDPEGQVVMADEIMGEQGFGMPVAVGAAAAGAGGAVEGRGTRMMRVGWSWRARCSSALGV